MTDDTTITGTETIEDELDSREEGFLVKREVSVEEIDLSTGLVTVSLGTDDNAIETKRYLPELLGWTNPDGAIRTTSVDHDVAGEAAEPIKHAVADQQDVDPDRILVQSLSVPNLVEYCLRKEDGAGVIVDRED